MGFNVIVARMYCVLSSRTSQKVLRENHLAWINAQGAKHICSRRSLDIMPMMEAPETLLNFDCRHCISQADKDASANDDRFALLFVF